MARIVMIRELRTQEYELAQEAILGRKSTCTIRVPSPKCSREHCRIFKGANGYFIEDLGSSNGTIVNDKKIGSHLLCNNDEIVIGAVTFKFLDKNDDPLVGKRLGKYQVLDKVGVGGMGVVYRASQVTLGREVALKVMSKRLADQLDFIQSFEREAKIAARLQHPNIIGIHDFGHEDGWYYFSMEFIDGENLLDMALRQGGLTIEECITFGAQIADALSHAHEQGILHKDIKPQNVMIDRNDNVKLADMGLASVMGGEDEEQFGGGGGVFMATPQYVAPEIIRRQDPDARSDLYSLSATLYHMLTGKPPFKSNNIKDLLKMHLKEPPVNPRELRPEIPAALADFILEGLAKLPDDRQQSARIYSEGLHAIMDKLHSSDGAKKIIQSTVAIKRSSAKARTVVLSKERFDTAQQQPGKGYMKYIIGGLAVFLLIILFLVFTGSKEKDAQMMLAQAKQLYVDGADEAAKEKLEYIVSEYYSTKAAEEARRMIEMSSGTRAQQELYRVRADVKENKITRDDAAQQLKLFLRQGMVSDEDINAIKEYIGSIGQDPDLRAKWERELEVFLGRDDTDDAREYLTKTLSATENEADRTLLQRKLDELEVTINTKAQQLCDVAKKQKEDKNLKGCYQSLLTVCRLYPSSGRWYAFASVGVAKLNELSLRHYFRAFTALSLAVREGTLDQVREAGFRQSEAIAATPVQRFSEQILIMQKAYESFYKKFLANTYEKTNAPIDHVEMQFAGKKQKVILSPDGDNLQAQIGTERKPIRITDIADDEVSRIVPRSEVNEQEALGAALYFYSTGNMPLAIDYTGLVSVLSEKYSACARDLELLCSGVAPVGYLSLMAQQPARSKNVQLSRSGAATFNGAGVYVNPVCFLQFKNAVIHFNTRSGGMLEAESLNKPLLSITRKGDKGVLTEGSETKGFPWPYNGIRVEMLENSTIQIKDTAGKVILEFRVNIPPQVTGNFILKATGKTTILRFDLGVDTKSVKMPEKLAAPQPPAEG